MSTNPYEKPLALTSPHMRGQKVKNAQWLLAGHNAWSEKANPVHTYYGRIDGEYGPATAGATKRAKYWLGYPGGELDLKFGPLLYNLLHGDSQLSELYAKNRAARIKNSEKPTKLAALDLARKEIGTNEVPNGSNCQKYGQWYGMNCVPWCAIFVSWCISHARNKDWKYSYVPTIMSDATRGLNGMSDTFSPQPGDLVCYNWGGKEWDHVEFFDRWLSDRQTSFATVGGNTSDGSFTNGGSVMSRTRSVTLTHQFIRLTI